MNIIERIDSAVQNNTLRTSSFIHKNDVLVCCKAEIERLLLVNETLKGLCEDYQAQIKQAKDYTSMTDAELVSIVENAEKEAFRMGSYIPETGFEPYRAVEAEVIKRANLVVKEN